LARRVKASGRKIFFRFGGDAVRTRMYRSFAQLKEGWTKNLTLLFPSPARLAVVRMVEFLLISGGVVIAIVAAVQRNLALLSLASALAITLGAEFFFRIRKAHFSMVATTLSLAGLPVFSYLLLRSRGLHKNGGVTWKGRTYSSGQPNRRGAPAI